jgi:uncharacterized alpha-E superfamily protein
MLSRVAESIYWMCRYVERAENIARFIDVNLNMLLDMSLMTSQQWLPLILTTGDLQEFQTRYGEATQENVIQFLTFDRAYSNSIISCLCGARENARSVREVISSEMWEQINDFYFKVQEAAARSPSEIDWPDFFGEVKLASHRFTGVMSATMSRNEGWHFGRMGKYLERADKTSRILDVKYFVLLPSVKDVGTTLDELQWMSLLKSASAYEMYRKAHRHRIDPTSIAEFLLLDRDFPRSIWFCIKSAEQSLYQITGNSIGNWHSPVERHFGKLRSDLDYTSMEEVMHNGLHEFLDGLQSQFNALDRHIFEAFLSLERHAA